MEQAFDYVDMKQDYYPYGQPYYVAGDATDYQFTGKEYDGNIGLHYFGARYYSADIGRWLVPDPAGQGFSPYSYCFNNPLAFVDPDGEFVLEFLIGAYIGGAFYNAMTGSERFMDPTNWDYNDPYLWGSMITAGIGAGAHLPVNIGLTYEAAGVSIGATLYTLDNYNVFDKSPDTNVDENNYYHYGLDVVGFRGVGGRTNKQSYQIVPFTQELEAWSRQYMTSCSRICAMEFVGYNLDYIYNRSKSRSDWDIKPTLFAKYGRSNLANDRYRFEFQGNVYRYDEIGNIGWGRIMGYHGIDPLSATLGAGLFQLKEVILDGQKKPIGFPFGDPWPDTKAILRGYYWYWFNR